MGDTETCLNCQEPYNDPRLLPCLHTFCFSCIEQMRTTSECVQCHQPFDFNSNELPVNHFLLSKKHINGSQDFPMHETQCAECADGTPATDYCQECPTILMCTNHAAIHQRKKRHSCASFGQQVQMVTEYCATHAEERLRAFCSACGQVVCATCMIYQHNGHLLTPLSTAVEQEVRKLQESTDKLKTMRENMEKAMTELRALHSSISIQKQTLTADISSMFNSLIHQLELRRNVLIKQTETDLDADGKAILLQQEAVTLSHDLAMAAISQTNLMIAGSASQPLELLRLSAMVNGKLLTLMENEPPLKPIVNNTVSFHLNIPTPVSSLGEFRRPSLSYNYTSLSMPSIVLSIQADNPRLSLNPSGIAQTKSGCLVVCCYDNHRLQLLTPSGGFLRSISCFGSGTTQLSSPLNVKVSADNELWVCDWQNLRLQCFAEDGTHLRKLDLPYRPNDVAILPNGDLAVTFKSVVCLYSREGELSWTCGDDDGVNFDGAYGIGVTSTGVLVVADHGNNELHFLSSATGEVSHKISTVNGPVAICVCSDDLLFVAERDPDQDIEQVSIFHIDGKRLHQFGTPGSHPGQFSGLNSICMLQDGSVAVADQTRIQIFTPAIKS